MTIILPDVATRTYGQLIGIASARCFDDPQAPRFLVRDRNSNYGKTFSRRCQLASTSIRVSEVSLCCPMKFLRTTTNNPAEQVPKPQNHDENLAKRIHRHDSQVIDIADVRCFDDP